MKRCQVELVPGGPALVRGADEVVDERGDTHPTTRPLVAVCTCDLSQRKPWCDGTHKFVVLGNALQRTAR